MPKKCTNIPRLSINFTLDWRFLNWPPLNYPLSQRSYWVRWHNDRLRGDLPRLSTNKIGGLYNRDGTMSSATYKCACSPNVRPPNFIHYTILIWRYGMKWPSRLSRCTPTATVTTTELVDCFYCPNPYVITRTATKTTTSPSSCPSYPPLPPY